MEIVRRTHCGRLEPSEQTTVASPFCTQCARRAHSGPGGGARFCITRRRCARRRLRRQTLRLVCCRSATAWSLRQRANCAHKGQQASHMRCSCARVNINIGRNSCRTSDRFENSSPPQRNKCTQPKQQRSSQQISPLPLQLKTSSSSNSADKADT